MNEEHPDVEAYDQLSADWSRQLIRSIYLPNGRILRTLKDAAECILERAPTPSAKFAAAKIIEVARNHGNLVTTHAAIRLRCSAVGNRRTSLRLTAQKSYRLAVDCNC
jgi:hypothetical protein